MNDKSEYYYSPKLNAFFSGFLFGDYIEHGGWPDDAIPISKELHQSLLESQAKGMTITQGNDKQPVVGRVDTNSIEDMIVVRVGKIRKLIQEANAEIDILNDAVDFGLSTQDEMDKLREWKIYRLELSRLEKSRSLDGYLPRKPQ